MVPALTRRLLTETDPRLLWRFLWHGGVGGWQSLRRHRARLRQGRYYPPFLFLSITNECNLRCRGCWVTRDNGPPDTWSPALLDKVIGRSRAMGNRFFGILGGEPLMVEGLWEVLGRHRDCYFQLFTNGTLLTEAAAAAMRRIGNVSPLVSVEGLEQVSDERRGGEDVFRRTVAGLEACRRHRLIFGTATSVCRTNLDDLVSERFLRRLVELGAHYAWYYIYRPVGPDPAPELALDAAGIGRLRRFLVEVRGRVPIAVIDGYWDERGRALCPASTGISCHVGPRGDVEPCPPIQFAAETVSNGCDPAVAIDRSAFLRAFRDEAGRATRGCILLEHPDVLREFMVRQGARDTTGRGTGLAELAAMTPGPSHDMPGCEVPERHWFYRFAKRHWFFGLGAYA